MRCSFPGLSENIYIDWMYRLSRFVNYRIGYNDPFRTISLLVSKSEEQFSEERKASENQ